ncbi:MAG: hypothetical protein ABI143_14200 [Caldimonas sp.]
MQRKDETKMAKESGALKPTGEAAEKETSDATRAKPTVNSRADRKAATRAANKTGGIQPAGEAARPIADPMKK